MPSTKPRGLTVADLQQQTTDQIIALMEKDGLAWSKSWITPSAARNAITGHVYSGINVIMAGFAMMASGSNDPRFLTFKQAKEIGAKIPKGTKTTPLVWAGSYERENEDGEKERRSAYKVFRVFNLQQLDIEDVDPAKLTPLPEQPGQRPERERMPLIDAYFANCGVPIIEGGSAAFYSSDLDKIAMPRIEDFQESADGASAETNFYAVLAHEMTHATAGPGRLKRECYEKYHQSTQERAKEELVAEIGSAMLCQHLGLETAVREDHAAYVASWLKALRGDKAFVFRAASMASKAFEWIEARQAPEDRREAA